MQFSKLYLKYKHCPTCRLFCFHYFMKLFAVGVYPRPHVLIKNFFINRGQLVHFLFPHISYFHFLAIITQRSNFLMQFYTRALNEINSQSCKIKNLEYAFFYSIKYFLPSHIFSISSKWMEYKHIVEVIDLRNSYFLENHLDVRIGKLWD